MIAAGVPRGRVCAAMCAATKVFGAVGFLRPIAFGAWRVRPETEVRAKTNPEEVEAYDDARSEPGSTQQGLAHVRYGRFR